MTALKQIVPDGWTGYSRGTVDRSKKVSFAGDRSWPLQLDSVLRDAGLRAYVDWTRRELTLIGDGADFGPGGPAGTSVASVPTPTQSAPVASPGAVTAAATPPSPTPPAAAKPAAVVAQPAPVQVFVTPPAKVVAPAPVAAPPTATVPPSERVWRLEKGKTLRENLARWLNEEGWSLVWSAYEGPMMVVYDVSSPAEFRGSLFGNDGAIARVLASYKTAQYPLSGEFFYGNKVFEVRVSQVSDTRTNR